MAPPTLSVDEIDELVYLARANEIADFKNEIEGLVKGKESSVAEIVKSAIDEESGNGVLHYASANGHAGTSPNHPPSALGERKTLG